MQRFIETASSIARPVEMTPSLRERVQQFQHRLKENGRIIETGDKPMVWEVPISRYDHENVNGRVYPKALWERVVNEQRTMWEGSPMLADHPAADSDGSPEKICGIWLEARVGNDGYVYGQFVPSGALGRDLQEHLVNGLKAGTSSSGFGELREDNKTVDPGTYQIERLSDWVLAPSQGTYFTYEATTQGARNASFAEASSNAAEGRIQENATMTTMSRLEEKKFRRDMESFLESAEKLTNPTERLAEFEEILSFLEDGAVPDLREAIEEKIAKEQETLIRQLENARELEEDFGLDTVSELKESIEILAAEAAALEESSQDWEKVATVLQERIKGLREQLDTRPTDAYVNRLKKKIGQLREEKAQVLNANKRLTKQITESNQKIVNHKVIVREGIEEIVRRFEEREARRTKRERRLNGQIERLQREYKHAQAETIEVKRDFKKYQEEVNKQPPLEPRFADKVKDYVSFNEANEVEKYWADLSVRHGKAILPFKHQLLSAKTFKEASTMYITKILPNLEETLDVEAARLPESVSQSLKERGRMLEKVGVKIDPHSSVVSRLPSGWK